MTKWRMYYGTVYAGGSPASFGLMYGKSAEAPGAGKKNMGPATAALDCTMFDQ